MAIRSPSPHTLRRFAFIIAAQTSWAEANALKATGTEVLNRLVSKRLSLINA
jgi:hypothetical protein